MTTTVVFAVAVAVVVALLADVYLIWHADRKFDRAERQHAREREQLLNRICHLAGNPWVPAPVDEWSSEDDIARDRLITSPEQLP